MTTTGNKLIEDHFYKMAVAAKPISRSLRQADFLSRSYFRMNY